MAKSTGKRFARRAIQGIDKPWQVNAAGEIRKYDRLQTIGKELGGLPTIDFGSHYVNGEYVRAYLGPVPPAGEFSDTCRLLDEIVCLAFHGYPPGGFCSGAYVLHLDANPWNCAADNIQWEADDEYAAYLHEKAWKRHMRPDFLQNRPIRQPVTTRDRKDVLWVGALSVPGWQPVKPHLNESSL